MTGNNAKRRREARDARRMARGASTVILGDNMVAQALGQYIDTSTTTFRELPAKRPGRHRWIASAAFILSDVDAAHAYDEDRRKFLDGENIFSLGIGCWDCEQPLGDGTNGTITSSSPCPAPAAD